MPKGRQANMTDYDGRTGKKDGRRLPLLSHVMLRYVMNEFESFKFKLSDYDYVYEKIQHVRSPGKRGLTVPSALITRVFSVFEQKELNNRHRHWIELLNDYDCAIKYHPGKANIEADALSRKETKSR
ncbi:hypothetical protein L1987_30073 [Smallanthus sonchifolius]|uniref:Uncharacterized protein n=1 Tax=Smallanthus sonchifolius TaxID=185202 RepID=A0ACB9I175_9ASTR|nr:hypothetical protein L1987_30073 [Smallanthus sonchifolius]